MNTIPNPLRAGGLLARLRYLPLAVLLLSGSMFSSTVTDPKVDALEAAGDISDVDLTEFSLEELMDIEVTIASRSVQKLSDVPGAVYVLSGDEIRRSGHTSVQEALRMVPGFYVSNWTTSSWDVTSRGFGTGTSLTSLSFLNELLVLIDGVVVRTPLFSGTWWALQDVDLEDVDRIEIIRGPGGILWGSHAVHGVVHIITKEAAGTQGGRVSARGQNDLWIASGRWGGSFGETGKYRVFYRKRDADSNHNPFLGFSQDWWISSMGARFDWGAEGERQSSVGGRFYVSELGSDGFDLVNFVPIPVTDDKRGLQLHGTTTDADGAGTFTSWLTYDEQDLKTEIAIKITTIDLEYKRDFELSDQTKLTAGVGYRQTRSDLESPDPFYIFFEPEEDVQSTYRTFAVHTWYSEDGNLDVVLGAALEHNPFTEFQFQPTLRANLRTSEDLSFWGSITRSSRTPSLEEVYLGGDAVVIGDMNFGAEKVLSFEVGARKQINDVALVDVAAFYNDSDRLQVSIFDGSLGQDVLTNEGKSETYGVELAVDVKPTERWSLRSAYTFTDGNFENKQDGSDLGTNDYHPRHQFNVRSYLDLGNDWEFDTGFYLVEDLGDLYKAAERHRIDARLGWNPCSDLSLYVGGQMLNDDHRTEFDRFDQPRRQFYFGMSWRPGSSSDE